MTQLAVLVLLSFCSAVRLPLLDEGPPEDLQDLQDVQDLVASSKRASGLAVPLKRSLKSRLASRAHRSPHGRLVIYFVGDSLVRNQYREVCILATGVSPFEGNLMATHAISCQSAELHAVHVWDPTFNVSVVHELLSEHPLPDVVYLDGGVHFLHLHPARPMHSESFDLLLHFEDRLQTFLQAWSAVAPQARLEVMPPFAICTQHFYDRYRPIATASRADPVLAARPCVDEVVSQGIAGEKVARFICERFFFTDVGSRNIQQAIYQAVQGLPLPIKVKTFVVDQHALTAGHCDMTLDGVHYGPMILQQLDLFMRTNGW